MSFKTYQDAVYAAAAYSYGTPIDHLDFIKFITAIVVEEIQKARNSILAHNSFNFKTIFEKVSFLQQAYDSCVRTVLAFVSSEKTFDGRLFKTKSGKFFSFSSSKRTHLDFSEKDLVSPIILPQLSLQCPQNLALLYKICQSDYIQIIDSYEDLLEANSFLISLLSIISKIPKSSNDFLLLTDLSSRLTNQASFYFICGRVSSYFEACSKEVAAFWSVTNSSKFSSAELDYYTKAKSNLAIRNSALFSEIFPNNAKPFALSLSNFLAEENSKSFKQVSFNLSSLHKKKTTIFSDFSNLPAQYEPSYLSELLLLERKKAKEDEIELALKTLKVYKPSRRSSIRRLKKNSQKKLK